MDKKTGNRDTETASKAVAAPKAGALKGRSSMVTLAHKSLVNRLSTTLLTILSIALSVTLLLGIERIRNGTRQSFESTVSGVDLIAGARSGPVNLLLYSVFRIGDATNNIDYPSYKQISEKDQVKWTIPISLGDSHKGYRVVGTNDNYFKYYRYAGTKTLDFAEGKPFSQLFDVVIGSEVAERLGYKLGDKVALSHGTAEVSFQNHDDKPFSVTGILEPTGTPVDHSLHVSLEAITALHIDWKNGAPPRKGEEIAPKVLENMDLAPSDITAFFIKLNSRIEVFDLQRYINTYAREPLMAILPGVTLRDLWKTIGVAEKSLLVVSLLVFVVSAIGMMIALLATLKERRREMAILRSVGAKKGFVFSMLIMESLILTVSGIIVGVILLYSTLLAFQPILEDRLGLTVGLFAPSTNDAIYLGTILVFSLVASVIPAWRAYRNSLSDGLTVKN